MGKIEGKYDEQQAPEASSRERHAAGPGEGGHAAADRGAENQSRAQRHTAEAKRQARQAQADVASAADDWKQQAQRATDEAAHSAEETGAQIRESAGRAADRARGEAEAVAMRQKEWMGEELQHFGAALRSAAERLHETEDDHAARYADMAAEQIDSTAQYLRQRDIGGLVDDVDTFARRRPEVFLGGMFLAGLGISRFLKASRP